MAAGKLRPVGRQTIVITGATSGIGLATARLASARGANLLLVARNEAALAQLSGELRAKGTGPSTLLPMLPTRRSSMRLRPGRWKCSAVSTLG